MVGAADMELVIDREDIPVEEERDKLTRGMVEIDIGIDALTTFNGHCLLQVIWPNKQKVLDLSPLERSNSSTADQMIANSNILSAP